MIKKTQKRFMLITLFILFLIFLGISSTVYFSSYAAEKQRVDTILNNLLRFPLNPGPGAPPSSIKESRAFVATLNDSHEVIKLDYDRNFYTIESINAYINDILNMNNDKGSIETLYYAISTSGYPKIAAIERSNEHNTLKNNLFTIILIEAIGFIVLTIASYALSFLVVKPLKEAEKKQKSFISNASHELKTPLTILASNTEVIKSEYGDNKWLSNILYQVERMNSLINELLTLSKFEENDRQIDLKYINISEVIKNEILSFEALAYESAKSFTYNIEENIHYNANAEVIKQLTRIFLDNAIKHGDKHIKISLIKNKHIEFTFWNDGSSFKEEDLNFIFQRFYKGDETKNQTNNFGLGLAIAKNICDHFKYEIKIDNSFHKFISFTILLK